LQHAIPQSRAKKGSGMRSSSPKANAGYSELLRLQCRTLSVDLPPDSVGTLAMKSA